MFNTDGCKWGFVSLLTNIVFSNKFDRINNNASKMIEIAIFKNDENNAALYPLLSKIK